MKLFKKQISTECEIIKFEVDWFARTNWISFYFWEKIKNMLLNFIYTLYTSVEEVLLKKYFLEIEFYTPKSNKLDEFNKKHKTKYEGDFKCYFPLVLKVKSHDEAIMILNEIIKQLQEAGFFILSSNISKEFASDEMLNHNLEIAKNKLKGAITETLFMETKILKRVPDKEETDEGKQFNRPAKGYSSRREKFLFSIRKVRPDALYLLPEFNVLIQRENYDE